MPKKEDPKPILIDVDAIDSSFEFDKIKAYRELFPEDEPTDGLAKQIFHTRAWNHGACPVGVAPALSFC